MQYFKLMVPEMPFTTEKETILNIGATIQNLEMILFREEIYIKGKLKGSRITTEQKSLRLGVHA